MSFEDPPTEDWIQCHQCNEWWHDSCSEPAPVTKDMDSSHAIYVEVEIDNQQTDLGIGCYVVNFPQHGSHLAPCMGQDDEYWVLNCKKLFPTLAFICRIIITMLIDSIYVHV